MTFNEAVDFVLAEEGGYVNHPDDPGGETKYGISKRAYPELDIRNLTRADAKRIYKRDYWQPSGAQSLHAALRLLHFDTAVNMGVGAAAHLLERSFNNTTWYSALRLMDYTHLPTWPDFGRGWSRRLSRAMIASDPLRTPDALQGGPDPLRASLLRFDGLSGELTERLIEALGSGKPLSVKSGVRATVESTMSGLEVLVIRAE